METFIQIQIYLSIILLSYRYLLKNKPHVKTSRIYLLSGITLSLVLPFLGSGIQFFGRKEPLFSSTIQPILVNQENTFSFYQIDVYSIITIVYFIGALILGFRLLFSIYALLKVKYNSQDKGAYIEVSNSSAAFSFMGYIFIGDTIPKGERKLVLKHEQIHIQKFHSIDIFICHLLEIFFWINPLIFRLKNLFEEIHEFEADELSCEDETQYMNLLLNQNLNQFHFSLIHQFNSNHLKNRIMRIKNKPQTKMNLWGLLIAACLFAMTFVINQQLFAQNDQLVLQDAPLALQSKEADLSIKDKIFENEHFTRAKFPGGQSALAGFIGRTVKYPKSVKEDLVGIVYLKFKINVDGSTSDFEVMKATNKEFEKEALTIVGKMPRWIPAEKDGKKVESTLTLPVKFNPNPSVSIAPPPPPPPPAPNRNN